MIPRRSGQSEKKGTSKKNALNWLKMNCEEEEYYVFDPELHDFCDENNIHFQAYNVMKTVKEAGYLNLF